MHSTILFLALSGLSSLPNVIAQADIPQVIFDCSDTPGVCTTMCWGAFCSGFQVLLSYDKPSKATQKDRRNKAGCGQGNRCKNNSPDPDGTSCDEYPFASTAEADNVQQVNRCVPPSEQNSQGGTLSNFYRNTLGGNPDQFFVVFGNPDADAVQYCDDDTQCLNDGNIYQGDDLAPDGKQSKKMHKRNHYMLESGMPILSTRDLNVGSLVKRMQKLSQAEMTLRKRGAGDPYELVDDRVKYRMLK